jgi:dipeptidyl aminopeptidase/acylaminoacyl peptidase
MYIYPMKKLIIVCLCFITVQAFAQLPETDIYLFDLKRSPKGLNVMTPKMISTTSGYNNQPYFSPDEKYLYFVSSVDSTNTEIYRYNLKRKKSRRITHTHEPEFSPRYTPGMDGLSYVSVERDKTTQHFYVSSLKGKKPTLIAPELKTIGYYEWISDIEFLTFELPEPFYFVRHNIALGRTDTLAQHIGRTFYNLRTKNKIVFVDKSDSLHWKLRTMAPENLRVSRKKTGPIENPILSETLPGEEDYCFMQDGSLLMGHDGALFYKKNPFRHPESAWIQLADLKQFGIKQFYRMAVSPDNTKMAIVVYKGTKP